METIIENALASAPSDAKDKPSRGILPRTLLQQVRSTAPFIFEKPVSTPYLNILRDADAALTKDSNATLTECDVEYFKICLSAHFGTVATFVPTDVDNTIRLKIWNFSKDPSVVEKMAEFALNSLAWDTSPVSGRLVASPISGEKISGHNGEWFSTVAGAYAGTMRRAPALSDQIMEAIIRELWREAKVYQDFKKKRDGLGIMRAATVIAHNIGDLNRVLDMWNLPETNRLRQALEAAYCENNSRLKNLLTEIGELNTAYMAKENHRHYALRVPRGLRQDASLLLPIGPFFDEWGSTVGRSAFLTPRDIGETVQALVDGWSRLKGAVGYARALLGILESFPGGLSELKEFIPAKTERIISSGPLRSLCSTPKNRFEGHWNQIALKFLKL